MVVAIISAASTSIANRTVESNIVNRGGLVSGRLVSPWGEAVGTRVELTARVQALDHANAPLEQLFDFVSNDTWGWIFVGQEWNSTWQGRCSYNLYPAVNLHLYSTKSSSFQDEIPLLGTVLPQWATVDPNRQGTAYIYTLPTFLIAQEHIGTASTLMSSVQYHMLAILATLRQ